MASSASSPVIHTDYHNSPSCWLARPKGRKCSVADMAGPRFLCSQTKLTFFGRPFRGPVNLISSVGIPRQRHPQPDSQAAKPPYLVPTFGGLPMGEVWC